MSADHLPEDQAPNGTVTAAARKDVGSVRGDAPRAGHHHARVPSAIERHYLRIGNRYFFPNRTPAFIDDGDRLRVKTENREVLHSVVAIAESRRWRVVDLRGTNSFRQGMWREAALRGIESQGYEPTAAEIREVQRALRKSGLSSHETVQGPKQTLRDRDVAPVDGGTALAEANPDAGQPPLGDGPQARQRTGARPPVRGILLAAAAAPYRFDPAQRMSFYVTVRTEIGDRTIWGADLERALAESASQPRIGDQVVLAPLGTRPVNVRVAARNAEGELVGEKKILAQRAWWSIETSDHLRMMEQIAMHIRGGKSLSDAPRQQHPELTTAAATLKLAEQYAERVTSDRASQQRLMQLIRDRMAEALVQGRSIHLPDRGPHPARKHARQHTARSREGLNHERV
ncbi:MULTISPECIES: LPD7 domain-containing protein [Variovorax]|uniref:LPD7 domain-containing protein n=1 Tax=Variovorax TaxID=34072 RepID=UPI002856A4AA|nr:LPD7 domain-containing protein [Variovorax sp. 3319]MDR6890768.1 hypothetical protein [Variovorax sp. 3319]